MSNTLLFVSSMVMSMMHVYCSILFRPLDTSLKLIVYAGSVTSVINHSSSLWIARIMDRTMMFIGACYDMYFLYTHSTPMYFLIMAIALFALSKLTNNYYIHASSHICIACNHGLMMHVSAISHLAI